MTLRSKVLGWVARSDLPPREPVFEETRPAVADARPRSPEPALSGTAHLGAYGPLVSAVRDELEHFIVSQLRQHLAIADRDRFVLTSIDVHGRDAEAADLLRRFMSEFKPEQVKRYLAREVIAALPNAAAIDVSQFAGLMDPDASDDAGEYRDLIAALGSGCAQDEPMFRVDVAGRWVETDGGPAGHGAPASSRATPITPLAGQRCEFELEDAEGRRRVVLQAVVPGRRYLIGKGEGCDISVNGAYASRRHAEIWLDGGSWWVADAGSTNGLRVESGAGVAVAGTTAPTQVAEGARMVLSARSEGPASDHPWIALRSGVHEPARMTPIANASPMANASPIASASPTTPLTAIRPAARAGIALRVTTVQGGIVRTLELHEHALPATVGRSRNQTLVIDRQHDGVSGHHLDILEIDAHAALVLVHGDNGVMLDGAHHGPGERVCWRVGQTLVLGASAFEPAACTLVLAHGGQD